MRKTREYDFNVYCPEDDVITLSAYRLIYTGGGMYSGDYSDWVTIRFNKNVDAHKECVRWLLAYVGEDDVYEDMDWWGFTTEELELRAPDTICNWVKSLPEYEIAEDADLITQAKEVGDPW